MQCAEPFGDLHFVGTGRLIIVVLHLSIDCVHQLPVVGNEDVSHFLLVLQISPQVSDHLLGQLVEQSGVVVVADVVKVNQFTDKIILQAPFAGNGRLAVQAVAVAAPQVLNQNLLRHWL